MLATRESSWGTAGCSGWSGKANLEKKASPVLILSKRNTQSLELTVYVARQSGKARPIWGGRKAGRCYTFELTKKRMQPCCRTGKARVPSLGTRHFSLPLSTEWKRCWKGNDASRTRRIFGGRHRGQSSPAPLLAYIRTDFSHLQIRPLIPQVRVRRLALG